MEPLPFIIESKDTGTLIEDEVKENSFVKLIDTLLLAVKNVTSGIGKISKTLIDTDILEFIIEMPVINTNIIIRYDLKIREQSVNKNFYLEDTPETILDIKKEPDEFHYRNRGELEVTPFDSGLSVVHTSNYNYDNEDLKIHEEYRIIPISNLANDICEDSIYSGSDMKKFSFSDYVATNEKSSSSKESSVCEESFPTLPHKNRHEIIHSGERPFSSAVSGKSLYSTFDKKRREKIRKGEKPHSCSVCGKSFICSFDKNTHEGIHSGQKPYSCAKCGRSFTSQTNKIAHEKVHHSGDKSYSCSVCGRCFLKAKNKKIHERTHTNEKPYSCSFCEKSFSDLSYKPKHEKIHTRERPYVCTTCGKSFITVTDKKKHERIHNGVKTCSIYGKCFSNSSEKTILK